MCKFVVGKHCKLDYYIDEFKEEDDDALLAILLFNILLAKFPLFFP